MLGVSFVTFLESMYIFIMLVGCVFIFFAGKYFLWRKTYKFNFNNTVAHETGHIMMLLASEIFPDKLEASVLEGKGQVRWEIRERKSKPVNKSNLLHFQMLLDISGYMGEIHICKKQVNNSHLSDMENWYELYHDYNESLDYLKQPFNGLFYHLKALKIRKNQEKVVKAYLKLNDNVCQQIFNLLKEKQVLDRQDLIEFHSQVILPKDFPNPFVNHNSI